VTRVYVGLFFKTKCVFHLIIYSVMMTGIQMRFYSARFSRGEINDNIKKGTDTFSIYNFLFVYLTT